MGTRLASFAERISKAERSQEQCAGYFIGARFRYDKKFSLRSQRLFYESCCVKWRLWLRGWWVWRGVNWMYIRNMSTNCLAWSTSLPFRTGKGTSIVNMMTDVQFKIIKFLIGEWRYRCLYVKATKTWYSERRCFHNGGGMILNSRSTKNHVPNIPIKYSVTGEKDESPSWIFTHFKRKKSRISPLIFFEFKLTIPWCASW